MKKKILILLFLVVIAFAALNTVSAVQSTERASIGDSEPNSDSYYSSITPDGRYIAFASDADNLVINDVNGKNDIFVKDGWTGSITRVSTNSTGGQANNNSNSPVITPDGRYIVFQSDATNLVSDDTNGMADIFVKDGWTGAITRVSTTSTGEQATGGIGHVYGSENPSITPDGRYIAFASKASNLVSGDTNGQWDIFVKDGWTGAITRVSTSATGAQVDGSSLNAVITPNGRYITFESDATNLVTGDTNEVGDVFVKDGWTGAITRISISATGAEGDDVSWNPVITPDGRYVAFTSYASNLILGDTNGVDDVFVKDGWTGAITRVSTTSIGGQAESNSWDPSISKDGRYVTFTTNADNLVAGDTGNYADIFVKDGWTGAITRVSVNPNGDTTNGDSYMPVITPDGKYIAYYSYADGIVTGDLNGYADVFVYDTLNNRNIRISTSKIAGSGADSGSYSTAITPDGRYIAFDSLASNLVADDTNGNQDVFVHDKVTNQTIRASTTSSGGQATGNSHNPSITPDGRYVAFHSYATDLVPGDTNSLSDVFVKDMLTGVITRVSTTSSFAQATGSSFNPSITPDGRYIIFESGASNLVSGDTNSARDIFVKDGWTGAITRVSTSSTGAQATGGNSFNPSITPDGRYIVFQSYATNLVSGDTNGVSDVFVKDGWTGVITRVSTSSTGAQADGGSYGVVITPNGRYIAFQSDADNLVSGDTNGVSDVFVKDGWTGAITRVSTSSTGAQADGGSGIASITSDGRYIAFESDATNLVSGDTNVAKDVFVKDGWTGTVTRVSTTSSGAQADLSSYDPVITSDGRYVAFESDANLLGYFFRLDYPPIPLDSNGASDIYVKSLW